MEPLARYDLPASPTGVPVLRARTVAFREARRLVVAGALGARLLDAEWPLEAHQLTPDGRYLLALGDDGKRAAVWDLASGVRVLELAGDPARRQSLRTGFAVAGSELLALCAQRNQNITLRAVPGGGERGWQATSGRTWFHLRAAFPLDGRWVAALCYRDGEQYDSIIAVPSAELTRDPMLLEGALTERPANCEWGYRIAAGPAGPGQAVFFRDPDWSPDDDAPDDPAESFRGLLVRDLASCAVVQRIAYDGPVEQRATLGADAERIAVELDGAVDLVSRATSAVARIDALALDPHRLEIARLEGHALVILRL